MKLNAHMSNVSCLAYIRRVSCFMYAVILAAATCMAESSVTNLPPLLRPQTLTDENGEPELNLVDPFRSKGTEVPPEGVAVPDDDGLLRTSMGEISSEFRILAITIPQDTNTPRSALIQFYSSDEPILVHEGDLVRVDRLGAGNIRNARNRRNAARLASSRARQKPGARQSRTLGDLDVEEELRKYVFYLNVKNIEPTFIEVYHNKKRPDETIRLNW